MALINVRVAEITQEAEGIRSFALDKIGFFKFPSYQPGSHIDVHCGEGIIRQYSLCGDPENRRRWLIAVKLGEPSRGGSELMHRAVEVGDKLEISSPRNNFLLDETAESVVLLAAGIGITPIIAMADRLYQLSKPFELHYFSRSGAHSAFRDRLQRGAYANKISFHEGLGIDRNQEKLRQILAQPESGKHVYICGPGPFMATAESLARENRPKESVKLERFVANPVLAGGITSAFSIELVRSGLNMTVAADETILEVLEANGIDAAFSCEQGVCGTCVTDIVDGEAEHRDSFFSEKQRASGKKMCICVSRSKGSKIVLDL